MINVRVVNAGGIKSRLRAKPAIFRIFTYESRLQKVR